MTVFQDLGQLATQVVRQVGEVLALSQGGQQARYTACLVKLVLVGRAPQAKLHLHQIIRAQASVELAIESRHHIAALRGQVGAVTGDGARVVGLA